MQKMLLLLLISFNISCVKTLVVERKMVDFQNVRCLAHQYKLPDNKVVSETVELDIHDCESLVGFSFEDWATKINPYLNDLNRRSGKE